MRLDCLALAALLLLVATDCFPQAREVKGTVYSYIDPDGMRRYSNKPPTGGQEMRTIKYTYYEGQKASPPYIFRCRVGKEDRYFSEPFVGCVVVGSVAPPKRTFGGFDCKGDCSGHQTGYDWATQRRITDPGQCGGKSQSFVEGCTVRAMGIVP